MDACWLYAVAWLFKVVVLSAVKTSLLPAPPVFAGLELAAWGLSVYLLDRSRLGVGIARWVAGLAGIAVCLGLSLALNPDVGLTDFGRWLRVGAYSLGVTLVLWAVGGYRASERPEFELVYSNFRLGLIVVVVASLLATLFAGNNIGSIWDGVGGVALWFFAWSLCALALGNREALRRETGSEDVRFWGLLLAGSLGCVFILATASGAFALRNLFGILQQIVVGILLLVGTVIYAVIYFIFWLMSLAPHLPIKRTRQQTPTPTPQPQAAKSNWLQELQRQSAENRPVDLPPELRTILMALAAIALIGVVAWLITRSSRRTQQDKAIETMEERESLGSWGMLYAQIRVLISRLLARFRPAAPIEGLALEDDLSDLKGRPEFSGTLSVRQIYARLQSVAAQLGYPRSPQQTPVEYLSVLAEAMPDLRGDFASITAAYIEARYGPLPASGPAVLAATNAWKRAEAALRRGEG